MASSTNNLVIRIIKVLNYLSKIIDESVEDPTTHDRAKKGSEDTKTPIEDNTTLGCRCQHHQKVCRKQPPTSNRK